MTNYITKTIKNGVEANIPVTSVNWQYGDVTIQTGGNYTAGNWIDITNDEIWLDGTYDKTTTHSDMQWPCPDGFHIPKRTERGTVKDIWTTLGAWAASSWPSMSNMLKLPLAWCRYSNTEIWEVWSWFYRSCSYANHYYWYELELSQYNINQSHDTSRSKWNYIRAFKDNPIVPTSSWTVLYQWTWSAGIFRDSSLWLISLSSDWTTWITIQDKNLGATTVWNSGDTLSEANCWNVFQWWNNNPFPWTQSSGTITTSSTTVSVAWYWPWNYYSSNTWITANPWQLTTDENNLRWWVSQWTWVSQTSWNLVINDNAGPKSIVKVRWWTQAEYDALTTKDPNTLYFTTES